LKRKYELVGDASAMLLFVKKNNIQGRTKTVEDGIMDKGEDNSKETKQT
jgi:hypothetical protein